MVNAINETIWRAEMVRAAVSLFARGYSFGTAGNLSIRTGDHILISATNSSFETMTPDSIAKVSFSGEVVGGANPSKEVSFHLAVYRARPDTGAVVHLHSTYSVAVSCLKNLNPDDALPVITPYYAMRVGTLPVVPYLPPGDSGLVSEVESRMKAARAVLLRNHGSITSGRDLAEAVALAEELEEQARLYFLLGDRAHLLSAEQVAELKQRFPLQ